ncbi:MAG: hypothetical protein J6J36_03830 [Clostridia bacterium]|nr:hypothetical protein [Clostridia bacterium]
MIKDKVGNLKKSLIKVENKEDKKGIENLIGIAIILVITIVAINYIWNGDKKNNKSSNKAIAEQNTIEQSSNISNDNLEKKLEDMLSQISGVGNVKVLITYSETSVVNPLYNEDNQESVTEEQDDNGGKRTISTSNNKKEIVYSDNNIITKSVTSPQIQGAVVIAKGAGDSVIKTNIIQAVEAATGLSTYKIQVFEMN